MRKYFFCFLIFINSFALFGLDYNLVPLFKDHEKRGEQFYAAYQDSKGFMWFASDMGVVRYDGHNLKFFSVNEGLPDNTVFGFFEDDNQRLWGWTFNGSLFFIKNNVVYANEYLNTRLRNLTKGNLPTSLFVKGNEIYVGYINHQPVKITIKYNPHIEIFKAVKNGVYIYYDDNEISFIYGTYAGIFFDEIIGEEYVQLLNDNIKFCAHNKYFFKIFLHCSGLLMIEDNILLLLNNAIYCFDKKGLVFEQFNKGKVTGALYDGKKVYVGFEKKGIYKAELTKDSLHFKEYIPGAYTPNLLFDKEGNMWIPTVENGVNYVPHFKFKSINFDPFSSKDVVFIEKIGINSLFFGVKNEGVYIYENGQITPLFRWQNQLYYEAMFLSVNESWLATSHAKIRNIVYRIRDKQQSFINNIFGSVKKMSFSQADSSVYIAQHNKISRIRLSDGSLAVDTLLLGRFNTIACVGKDVIYSTHQGLYKIDVTDIEMPPIQLIKDIRINEVAIVSDSIIVAATHGYGLIVYNGGSQYKIKAKNGLVDNVIKCLLYDENRSALWVGTPRGLSRVIFDTLNFQNYVIQNFDINSGLTSNIINDMLVLSDTLYLATNNGITVIPVANIPEKTPVPLLIMNSVKVNREHTDYNDFSGVLKHNERQLEFEFDAISYSFSSNIMYYYRMIPGDTAWNNTQHNKIAFDELNYGKHTFELKACTYDNTVCSDVFVQSIIVKYPFWFKWWFFVLLFLFTALLVLIFIRLRIRQIRAKLDIKRRLMSAEKKALRAQMNPHFIFNALTSIQKFIVFNDTEKADYYVKQFAKLIRLVLETSKDVNISIYKEINILSLYLELEKLRLNNKFNFDIKLNNIDSPEYVFIPSMLLQPIVENAVWHGIAYMDGNVDGQIDISISQKDNYLECIIQDNGIGRRKSKNIKIAEDFKTSLGLGITKQRIELNQNRNTSIEILDVYDENGKAGGTKVVIII